MRRKRKIQVRPRRPWNPRKKISLAQVDRYALNESIIFVEDRQDDDGNWIYRVERDFCLDLVDDNISDVARYIPYYMVLYKKAGQWYAKINVPLEWPYFKRLKAKFMWKLFTFRHEMKQANRDSGDRCSVHQLLNKDCHWWPV